jgi:hypothetical protein
MTQITLVPSVRKGHKNPVERSATFEAVAPGQGLLTITTGDEAAAYWLTEVGADFGRGFRLEKQDAEGEGYYVLVGNELDTRCDCLSGQHRGKCKHLDTLRTLIDSGALPRLCPACHERFANEHGHPCPPCQMEISADMDAIAYTGRRDKFSDAA